MHDQTEVALVTGMCIVPTRSYTIFSPSHEGGSLFCSCRSDWLKLWKRGNVPVGAFSRVSARTLLWGKGNEKSSWLYIKLIFWPFQTEHWSPAAAAAAAGGIHVSDSHEGECRWWLNRRFIYSCLMRRCWGSSLCLFVDSLCFQLVVTRCRCACITWAEPRSLMWCARRRCSLMATLLLLLLLGHIAGRPRGRGLHSICSFCNVCVVSSLCNHCHVTASRAGTLQLKDHPSSARCVFYTTARDFQTSNTA